VAKSFIAADHSGGLQVSCGGCGSVVAFEPPEVAGTCSSAGRRSLPRQRRLTVDRAGWRAAGQTAQAGRSEPGKAMVSSAGSLPMLLKKMAQPEGNQWCLSPFLGLLLSFGKRLTPGERAEYYYVTETYTEA